MKWKLPRLIHESNRCYILHALEGLGVCAYDYQLSAVEGGGRIEDVSSLLLSRLVLDNQQAQIGNTGCKITIMYVYYKVVG
jgi:hypothetical protein